MPWRRAAARGTARAPGPAHLAGDELRQRASVETAVGEAEAAVHAVGRQLERLRRVMDGNG